MPFSSPSWHSRGYLPHFEGGEVPQAVTFRLADSFPVPLLEEWRAELTQLPANLAEAEQRRRIESQLDIGNGECLLSDPRVSDLVENALLHFDGSRYLLHAWVVMPNHVHALVTPFLGRPLSGILHSWKSYTAKHANLLLERMGPFWQKESFDRAIRDEGHFLRAATYIESNPVKARLCRRPEDWPYGSARLRA